MLKKGFIVHATCLVILLISISASGTVIVDIPLDHQINIGQGDAVYPMYNSVLTFEPAAPPDEPDGFARLHMVTGGGAGGWYYGPHIDFVKAGIGPINLADPIFIYYLGVQCRYFQDPATNTNPYNDAPIYFRLYTYDDRNTTYLDTVTTEYSTDPETNSGIPRGRIKHSR